MTALLHKWHRGACVDFDTASDSLLEPEQKRALDAVFGRVSAKMRSAFFVEVVERDATKRADGSFVLQEPFAVPSHTAIAIAFGLHDHSIGITADASLWAGETGESLRQLYGELQQQLVSKPLHEVIEYAMVTASALAPR